MIKVKQNFKNNKMIKKKYTFEEIRSMGLLAYEYIRGSHAYSTEIPKNSTFKAVSDIDTSGVFIAPKEQIFGLGLDYQETIADAKNDNVWNELGKWFSLLTFSNPNVLESLYMPQRCIIFENDIIKEIKSYKDIFLSKKIYETFGGYAKSQIKKARGLNKAIVNPVYERLKPIDFIYTFYGQGSTKINNWLEYRGLKQRYCGLVNIPNMHEVYGLYYDFGTHIEVEYGGKEKFNIALDKKEVNESFLQFLKDYFNISSNEELKQHKIPCYGFRGILNVDETSNELRLANIPKGIKPLCHISYNVYGYTKHCGDYKRYTDWVKNRNPNRYEINKENTYDVKNMYHMFRLIHMCTEILNGDGVNIDRKNIDADFLVKVRLGTYTYDEVMEMLQVDSAKMEEAFQNTKLQDSINIDDVNQLLIDIRKKYYDK